MSASANNRRGASSDKMSRSIESQVEAGLRTFLAKSGAPAIASSGNNNMDSHFSASAGLGGHGLGGGLMSTTRDGKIRTTSADSSLLPPINKDSTLGLQGSLCLDPSEINDLQGAINDDDDEIATQSNNRKILESLTNELQQMKQIRNNGKASQKLVSGTQFRIPQREPVACPQCEHFDRNNRKLKETNRMLRLQVARLEEKIHDLRKSKSDTSGSDTAGGADVIIDGATLMEHKQHTKKQLEALETELSHWKRKFHEVDQEKVVVECNLVAARKETLERTDEINRLKQLLAELKGEKEALEKELRQNREKFLLELEANTRSALKSGEEYAKCDQLCKQLRDELDSLRGAHAGKLDSLSSAESALQQQQVQLRAVETERDKLKEKLNKAIAEVEIAERARRAAETMLSDEQARFRAEKEALENDRSKADIAAAEVNSLRAEVAQLRAENKSNGAAQLELVRRMTADSETTKQALEKAITSSVRLCVVAPTVNVHIPTGKMNLKSSVSEAALKEFLSTEVLQKYTFLFKQRAENASPEEGLSIQLWVEQMLKNMQSAIESHVYRAIEGSS